MTKFNIIEEKQYLISRRSQDIIADIHALHEDLEVYERKYGVLSETFYELYTKGEEPDDDA
jgi:hypothetical protein